MSSPTSTLLLCNGVDNLLVLHSQVLGSLVSLKPHSIMDKPHGACVDSLLGAISTEDLFELCVGLHAKVHFRSVLVFHHQLQGLSFDLRLGLAAGLVCHLQQVAAMSAADADRLLVVDRCPPLSGKVSNFEVVNRDLGPWVSQIACEGLPEVRAS